MGPPTEYLCVFVLVFVAVSAFCSFIHRDHPPNKSVYLYLPVCLYSMSFSACIFCLHTNGPSSNTTYVVIVLYLCMYEFLDICTCVHTFERGHPPSNSMLQRARVQSLKEENIKLWPRHCIGGCFSLSLWLVPDGNKYSHPALNCQNFGK